MAIAPRCYRGSNFGKETVYKTIFDFIVNFDKLYHTTWRCPETPRIETVWAPPSINERSEGKYWFNLFVYHHEASNKSTSSLCVHIGTIYNPR